MAQVNPYRAPQAAVAAEAAVETQPVRIFSISGRMGRVRYIAYGIVMYIVVMLLVGLLAFALGQSGATLAMGLGWILMLVFGFMFTIQRCHDFNASGWLSLVGLIPLVNLIFWFIPGTDGPNDYGPPTPPNGVGVIVGALVLPLVAVVGILAAVAIPAYGDYTHRARTAEALAHGHAWRTAITEHYLDTRRLPSSVYELKVAPPADAKFARASLGGNGVVVLTFNQASGAQMANKTILLRPSAAGDNVQWDCTGGTLEPKYRPATCRPAR